MVVSLSFKSVKSCFPDEGVAAGVTEAGLGKGAEPGTAEEEEEEAGIRSGPAAQRPG